MSQEKSLQQIWEELAMASYETDKGSVHSYLDVYAKILAPYRHVAKNVLEIGLFNGHSLRMWEQYFTNATVRGIDCDEQPHGGLADLRPMIEEGGHKIHIFNAEDPEQVLARFYGMKFEVIIDDSSHNLSSQLLLYKIFKPYLAAGGIMAIEDIQSIDEDYIHFINMDAEKDIQVVDLRHKKNRYDDVMVTIKDKANG